MLGHWSSRQTNKDKQVFFRLSKNQMLNIEFSCAKVCSEFWLAELSRPNFREPKKSKYFLCILKFVNLLHY